MNKQTTFIRKEDAKNDWYIVDATDMVVGRLASRLATVLMGKNKPVYTPHTDCGDFVVVTNCEKVCFTGNKWRDKVYRYHSGMIGGLKENVASDILEAHPERILMKAVERMLPKTKMGRAMIKKLKVYAGSEHPHEAQNPKELSIEANARRK